MIPRRVWEVIALKEVLLIDCCIRRESSRTRRLAQAFVNALDPARFHVTVLDPEAEGLRPLLAKKKGCCVMTCSNTITNSIVRMDWVELLTNLRNREQGMDLARMIPREKGPAAYSSSKCALARWIRRVSPNWAVDGLRINGVAPGNTTTPMTKNLTEQQKDAALLIPIPTRYGTREFLDAEEIANAIVFLASKKASGINGVVLFVDGGIDALMRSERF